MLGKIKRIIYSYSIKDIVKIVDFRYGLGALERVIFSNWFNPFLTIYLNLRSFPMEQAWKMPVFVFGLPRIYNLSGSMEIVGKVTPGMIRFNDSSFGAPSIMSIRSELSNIGKITFKGRGRIGTGTKIHVAWNAYLELGANFKIMDMCNIGCYNKIIIGDQAWIVHRCQVFDSNYHYLADYSKGIIPSYIQSIHIGKGCWICNTTTIMGRTILPNFTIVASNSLVSKDYSCIPENSMIAGVPAKLVKTGLRRVDNSTIERRIRMYYQAHVDELYHISSEETMENVSFWDR